jgi:hypothetical protein
MSGGLPQSGSGIVSTAVPLSLARSAVRIAQVARNGMAGGHGASYPVTAVPPVSHPPETPCVDLLFTPTTPPLKPGQLPVGKFADYNDHPFRYHPPDNCPGPYARIIMKVQFRVSEGVQYDRTGAIWIGATNVFFGTTSEPQQNAGPQWEIERDVSEYAPIFANKSIGQASVYNIVNSQYTGIIYGRAELDFYPAAKHFPAATAADAVYPLSGGKRGGYVYLDGPTDQMTGTFTFPKNVEAAYLDLFLQGQSNDEFWYSCFPDGLAKKLDNCGGTAFREGEVTVDGQAAGVAPVYPYIFTGGFDPFLWIPIPGVETLNFTPYRLNLTPFAGTLDDGKPHTIAVSVYNDDNYFTTNGALLVYEDHGSSQVTGGLTSDGTPALPSESITRRVKLGTSGTAYGTIKTIATHPVSMAGYVKTSQGRIETRVTQSIAFSNLQKIDITSAEYLQNITQQTTVTSTTTTIRNGQRSSQEQSQLAWPLNLHYLYTAGTSKATQNVVVGQTKNGSGLDLGPGGTNSWLLQNTVNSSDTLTIVGSGFTPSNGKSNQQYKSLGVGGACWDKTIESRNYVIVGTRLGC